MSDSRKKLNNIERIESMEEKFGISIEGLNAEIQYIDVAKMVTVYAEVFSTSGKTIKNDIEIVATAYNKDGEVIGIEKENIYREDFFALQALKLTFFNIIDKPERIRIYPKGM